jgi:phospholipid transport system substrate-binding protein
MEIMQKRGSGLVWRRMRAGVRLFAAVAVLSAIGLVPSRMVATARAVGGAMEVVQQTVNQALEVLRNKQLPLAERQAKLRQIVEATFDFREMARSALGYHWRSISPAQRQEFSQVFTTFIEDSYLSKINDYSGQQVQFIKQTSDGPQYAQVNTQIVQGDQDPIALNYRLQDEGGGWKIYDVTVDAISIIANYRNQFNRVMNNKGYATLISDLRSKQAALAASLGTHH